MGYKNYASPTAKAGTSAGGSSSGNSGAAKKDDSGSSGSGDADKKETQPKSKFNDNNWACNYYKIYDAEAKAKLGDVKT